MSAFTQKNENRKHSREKVGTAAFQDAQYLRRHNVNGGSFGTEDTKVYNELVVGTTGNKR